MWVINNEKARAQTLLKNDIQNLATQLTHEESEINKLIAMIERAIGGSLSGEDRRLTDMCREAQNSLGTVHRLLSMCNEFVSQLEVREQVNNDRF